MANFHSNRHFFLYILIILFLLCLSLVVSLIVNRNENDETDYQINSNGLNKIKSNRSNKFNISLKFSTSPDKPQTQTPYIRLKREEFQPLKYEIFWDLTKGSENFAGQVIITVNVLKETNRLPVQLNSLNVTEVKVWFNGSSEELTVTRSWLDKSDIYFLQTADNVTAQSVVLIYLKFTGTYNNLGFLVHQSSDSPSRITYMTKFEPIHARKAFPCFDEPDMKAHFKLTVKHNSSLTAYSNMPLESTLLEDEGTNQWTTSVFQESPLMTTYLVALVVCDCQRTVSYTNRGLEVGIITLKEDTSKTDCALNITIATIEYFEQHLEIPYKFPKLDIFASPYYPSFGMEHSGLIIQVYHRLLYKKDGPYEVYNKEGIYYTTTHEIAHQWFGNLVTLRWWEHTWLNEGFATFYAIKAVEAINPGMHADDIFLINRYRGALSYDFRGLYSSWNKTVSSITYQNQIQRSFSWLSYQKGGSILRMMENFIGEENMRKAVRSYLIKYSESNVITNDFSHEVQKFYNKINMSQFIDSWTKQSGCPIITIIRLPNGYVRLQQRSSLAYKTTNRSTAQNEPNRNGDSHDPHGNNGSASINGSLSDFYKSNSPVTSSGTSEHSGEFTATWLIPLTFKASDGSSGMIWFDKPVAEYQFCSSESPCSWILFNVDKKGYYLVNYSRDDWFSLIDALNSSPEYFTPHDYVNLLFDAYHLSELGSLEPDIFLTLISNAKRFKTLAPLALAISWSKVSYASLSFGDNRYLLYQFRRDLLEAIYEEVSMLPKSDHEDYFNMIIRSDLLEDACEMKVPACLSDSSRLFESWITNRTHIPVYIQSVVFRFGMIQNNNIDHWNLMLNMLITGNLTSIRGTAMIKGLFSIQDEELKEKAYSILKGSEYEIEASVLIESKCSTSLKSKANPVKASVIKWLVSRSEHGYPWRLNQRTNENSETRMLAMKSARPEPYHYRLNLSLTSIEQSVNGEIGITMMVKESTLFSLLSIGPSLSVTSVSVWNESHESRILIANSFHYRASELFVIEFQSPIEPGNYLINLKFNGSYKDSVVSGETEQTTSDPLSSDFIELIGGPKLFPCLQRYPHEPVLFHVTVIYRSLGKMRDLETDNLHLSNSIDASSFFRRDVSWETRITPSQLVIHMGSDGMKLNFIKNGNNESTRQPLASLPTHNVTENLSPFSTQMNVV